MNFDLYYKAVAADEAWQKEVERMYGSLAGDARYTKDGTATPELRALAEAKHIADAEWRNYVENVRQDRISKGATL